MAHPYYKEKVLPFLESNPVANQLVKIPFFGTGFELKELAENLRPDEEIRYITACKMNNSARVLVCVTNLRFHVLDKGLIISKFQQSIDLSKISSVTRGRELVFGSVNVSFMGEEIPYTLTGFWLKDTENFQRALQDAITDYNMGRAFSGNGYHPYGQQPMGMGQLHNMGWGLGGFSGDFSGGQPVGMGQMHNMGLGQNNGQVDYRGVHPHGHNQPQTPFNPAQGHVQPPVQRQQRVSKPVVDTSDLDDLKRRGLIDDWTYKRKVEERRNSL